MRATRRRWGIIIAIVAAVLGAVALLFRPQAVPVDFVQVVRGQMSVTIDEEAKTRVQEAYVVSAPLAGRLRRIEQHAGDQVVAGQTVLAVIEPGDPVFLDARTLAQAQAEAKAAEAGRDLARTEVLRARAELEFAQAEFKRAEVLAARDTVSRRALDTAALSLKTREAALATAQAALRVREYELETARARLIGPGDGNDNGRNGRQCCIEVRAPVSGRILRLLQESEAIIAPGAPLVEIGDPGELEIVAELLSADAVRVREGAEVVIDGWGGGPLRGIVRRVEPYGFTKVSALGIEEQRVVTVIDFNEPVERLRSLGHGYRLEVHIVVWESDDVVKVPVGAAFRQGQDWAVFVVDGGRAALRVIQVGQGNGVELEAKFGVEAGARVILHPSERIADGIRVVARDSL